MSNTVKQYLYIRVGKNTKCSVHYENQVYLTFEHLRLLVSVRD